MEPTYSFTSHILWFLGGCLTTIFVLICKYHINVLLDRRARRISSHYGGFNDGFFLLIALCNTSKKPMVIIPPGLLHRREFGLDRWTTLWPLKKLAGAGIFGISCETDDIDLEIYLDGEEKTMEEVCGKKIKVDSCVSWNFKFKTMETAKRFIQDCDSLGFLDRRQAFYSVRAKPIKEEIEYLIKNPIMGEKPDSPAKQSL